MLSLPENPDQSALFRARIKINNITAGDVFGFYAVEPGAGELGDEIDNEFLGTLKPTLWLNIHKDGDQLNPEDIQSNPFGSASDWERFNTYTMRWSRKSVTWHINDVGNTPPTRDTFSAANNAPTKKAVGPLVPDSPLRVQLNTWAPAEDEFPQAYNAGLKPATSEAGNQTYFYDVKWVQIGRSGILTAKGKPKNVVP